MNIREACEADIEHVLRLYAQPEFDNGSVLDPHDARALFRRFSDYPDYRLYVAEKAGAIVGSFALLIMINIGHRGAPSAVIEDVVVDPAMQGRGVGKEMMCAAMKIARSRKCYKLVLSSNSKRARAHAFYESLGFQPHGISFHVPL